MFLYKVYEPAPMLKPFVANYSIVENSTPVAHYILPHAALTLGIQYRGRMEISGKDPQAYESYSSGIIGIQDAYRNMRKEAHTGMLAINFTEAGAGAFFQLPLHELYNSGVSLDQLIPASTVERLEEQVTLALTADERVQRAEAFLGSLLHRQEQDPLIIAAIGLIRQAAGIIRVEELAKQLCISASRLEKRFRQAVGVSPKKFASMVRIETIVKSYQSRHSLTKLAYEAGYFDQAHFNRDFKNYTGLSPTQLFSNPDIDASDLQHTCGLIYGSDILPKRTDTL